MRILLAEHFHPCPDRLAVPLRQAGHAVDVIDDGAIADIALASEDYALAILDFALPRMDGQTVLSRLRARGQRLPVLMLTSGERAGDRVRILDLGADDCLSRPFAQDELEARLRALLRRAHAGNARTLACGPLTLDTTSRLFLLDDAPLYLPRREQAVLEILMQKSGRPVSKDQLFNQVFGLDEDANVETIELYVHRLRKKLADSGASILTLRGIGYLLEPGGASPR